MELFSSSLSTEVPSSPAVEARTSITDNDGLFFGYWNDMERDKRIIASKSDSEENSTLKVTIFQAEPKKSAQKAAQFIDDELTNMTKRERKPDVIVLPENWIDRVVAIKGPLTQELILNNKALQCLSDVAKKHSVYAVLGTVSEFCDKKRYITSIFLRPDGTLLGFYRKRKATSEGAHETGNEIGIFECSFGRTALMICFDIENDDIFKETLSYGPAFLFNPTFIPAPSTARIPDLLLSDWKIGMETMSRKFETTCTANKMTLVRCDAPFTGNALGSSQVISPYATYYTPTYLPVTFSVFIDKRMGNAFQLDQSNSDYEQMNAGKLNRSSSSDLLDNYFPAVTKVVTQTRTAPVDNTGSRYTVFTYADHSDSIHHVQFLDNMRVASASGDGTVRIWNIHRIKCLQILKGEKQVDGIITSTAFSKPQNQLFGSLSERAGIASWSLSDPSRCDMISTPTRITKLVSPRDPLANLPLYCVSADGGLSSLDARTNDLTTLIEAGSLCHGSSESIRDCVVSLASPHLMFLAVGNRIVQVDERVPSSFIEIYKDEEDITTLDEMEGGVLLFAKNSRVSSFDISTSLVRRSFQCNGAVTRVVPISNRHFLSSNTGGTFELWNVDYVHPKPLHTFYGHTMPILDMKHDGGHNVITAGEENNWKMWSFAQNRHPAPLRDLFL
eukprot:TRINITY_DN1857_c0_g1_i4.p1 TRINITY_DN1857_c0_g1~~TRINITY_DN1857_c0_g1_i4.p1  ORF type:complete len:673 (-),score=128.41 TRINITY_DN1857_c0_g1_i4:49-2067(-)